MTLPPSVQAVVDLVNAAAGDLTPTLDDCESLLVWWGDVASYDHADEAQWIMRAPSHDVPRECGCGCGGIYNHCEDCGRRVERAEDYGNPDTTSSYWLCRECRDEWEERGQYNRDGDCVSDL